MTEHEMAERLIAFIRERFLSGDPQGELDLDAPLLEWGVLNSINTAMLVTHILDELGLDVPLDLIDARAFRSVRGIASALHELSHSR